MLEPYPYNDWINQLCAAYDVETLLGKTYFIDYPKKQEFTLNFGRMVDTQEDFDDPWISNCYPKLDLVVPNTASSNVAVESVDMSTKKAVIGV